MMLICHTMNFFYPKNKFTDINYKIYDVNKIDKKKNPDIDYNEIYYTNQNEKQLCANVNIPEIPCDIVKKCEEVKPQPTKSFLDSLSNSEIAVIYKVMYEDAAREILTRSLHDIKKKQKKKENEKKYNPWHNY